MIPKWSEGSSAPARRIPAPRCFRKSSRALPGAAVPHTTRIFDKFESGHVSQFLDQAHEAGREERQIRREDRRFRFGYVLIGVGIFVFLTWFLLPDHAALYLEILKALGIFGAGAAGGYGLRAYQERSPDPSRDS